MSSWSITPLEKNLREGWCTCQVNPFRSWEYRLKHYSYGLVIAKDVLLSMAATTNGYPPSQCDIITAVYI